MKNSMMFLAPPSNLLMIVSMFDFSILFLMYLPAVTATDFLLQRLRVRPDLEHFDHVIRQLLHVYEHVQLLEQRVPVHPARRGRYRFPELGRRLRLAGLAQVVQSELAFDWLLRRGGLGQLEGVVETVEKNRDFLLHAHVDEQLEEAANGRNILRLAPGSTLILESLWKFQMSYELSSSFRVDFMVLKLLSTW